MHYYFITGVSSGIGLALLKELLSDPSEEIRVLGCSRREPDIKDHRFTFFSADFSKVDEIHALAGKIFKLAKTKGDQMILFNNAGTIGHIGKVGQQVKNQYEEVFTVNSIAPSLLIEAFICQYQQHEGDKMIFNISSGAANKDIEGWAAYCASKAALDRFTTVCVEEQKGTDFPIELFSVAPGVVDTAMQAVIRKGSFPMQQHFLSLYEEHLLSDARTVASQLLRLVKNPQWRTGTILSLRNMDN